MFPEFSGEPVMPQPTGADQGGRSFYTPGASNPVSQFAIDPNTGAASPLSTAGQGADGSDFSKPQHRRGTLQAVAAYPADNLPEDTGVAVDLENVPEKVKVQLKIDVRLKFLFFPGLRNLEDDSRFGASLTELFGEDNVYFSTPPDDASSVGADDSASGVASGVNRPSPAAASSAAAAASSSQAPVQDGQMYMTHRGPLWVPGAQQAQ